MKRRSKSSEGAPRPVDVHVGQRIKLRRRVLHISQETLAADIGVTFQQVQKYESGHNRVSASRLVEICKVLKVLPQFFFEGLPDLAGLDPTSKDPMMASAALSLVADFNKLSQLQQQAARDVIAAMRDR